MTWSIHTSLTPRRVAVAAVALAALPLLAGCFNGPDATTTAQATMNSGNGAQSQVGAMKVENATLVRGADGTATLAMSIINVGEKDDAVQKITIAGQPAVVTDGNANLDLIPVPAQSAISFGYGEMGAAPSRWANTYTATLPVSGYVPVSVLFANAGQTNLSVLVVPPVGYYEGIAPNPPMAPVAPTAPAAAAASPAASS